MKGAYLEILVSNFVLLIQIFLKLISNMFYNPSMGSPNHKIPLLIMHQLKV